MVLLYVRTICMIGKGYTAVLSERIDSPKQYLNNTCISGALVGLGHMQGMKL